MALRFDPHRTPPAARLLAIIIVAVASAWVMSVGGREQAESARKDPAAFYRKAQDEGKQGLASNILVSAILVTVIVFSVDGLTHLLGRWLKEREIDANPPAPPS